MGSELKIEEKLAIRDYMRKMIAVPGIIVAVIMFLVGFFIKDVAKKDAYFKANEMYTKQIIELTEQSSNINSEVKFTVNESKRLFKEANDLRNKLETASSLFKESLKVEEGVAESLAGRSDFKEKVARECLNEMNKLLNSINSRIAQLVRDLEDKNSKINELISRTQFIKVIDKKTIIDAGPNELVIQTDGNVVVYKKVKGRRFSPDDSLWSSETHKE